MIRVAISGADKDSLASIPETIVPKIVISRNKDRPSAIQLPIIPRK